MSEKPFSFQTSGKVQQGMQLGQASLQRFAPSGRALTSGTIRASSGAQPSFTGEFRYTKLNNLVVYDFWASLLAIPAAGGLWGLSSTIFSGSLVPVGVFGCSGTWVAEQGGAPNGNLSGWITSYGQFAYRPAVGPGVPSYLQFGTPWTWAIGDFISGYGVLTLSDAFTSST